MANQWFRFKQFTIKQEKTAMKVGTDGVLLGAWADIPQSGHILDVGTGTGLIALMAAQRSIKTSIIGIDIDKAAFLQAKENVQQSKWADRISILLFSLQDFAQKSNQKFDFIISNPPFFDGTKASKNQQRTLARHNISLSMEDFFTSAAGLLATSGRLALIIPSDNLNKVKSLAEQKGLFLKRMMNVKPTPAKPPKRVMVEFSFSKEEPLTDEMILEVHGRHSYSEAYESLTKDFYLFFD